MKLYNLLHFLLIMNLATHILAAEPEILGAEHSLRASGTPSMCGTYSLNSTQSYNISSALLFVTYPPYYHCQWQFLGTDGCMPTISCSTFDLISTSNCASSSDYLKLSDGSDASTRFCGKNGPNAKSNTSMLVAELNTGLSIFSSNKGMLCTVSCASNSTTTNSTTTLPHKPPKTTTCECGVPGPTMSASARIVGGTNATQGEWRWQVALVLRGQRTPFCGGSLINDQYILTAAHCFVDTGYIYLPIVVQVVLNEYNLTSNNETTIVRSILQVIPHPLYSSQTHDYDVAVLKLLSPLNITSSGDALITPVCLPPRNTPGNYTGDNATITGWGYTTERGSQSTILQQAQVPVIPNAQCSQDYQDLNIQITPRMLCALQPGGGVDECQGDYGGPMTVNGTAGKFTQIGVSSFGQGCASPDYPGVYASVTEATALSMAKCGVSKCRSAKVDLNDWIRSVTRSATWCQE